MRGEHCVAGATILSAIAVILLVFAHIGQISSGALVKSIHMAEVNVAAYGNGYAGGTNKSAAGLYDTKNDKLGTAKGLRQYYRYGLYNACGYQKDGSGICNSSTFAYPMEPLSQLLADTPEKFFVDTRDIIPTSTFKENGYNHGMSRGGSVLIFAGSVLAAAACIFGVIKLRISFLIAAICSGLGAFLLMIGAALWTAVIAKDNFVNIVKVRGGNSLGIKVTAGASLYLTWVAFAFVTLSCFPYVIACCTYRK
ncbi:claudin family protein [Kwoniella heveanensis CBS 569]|nr:claudin family protein [Kwoniella heveanensis CBS 569]